MDKEMLNQVWDQMRQKYGIYLRLLDAIPEEKFHSKPIPNMRTPAELVVHTSGSIVRNLAQGVEKGDVTADESSEESVAAGLTTKADVIAYARECWKIADQAVEATGDEQLSAMVTSPWDMTFPGSVGITILGDEFMHHRGQLYAYVRACGVAPPLMYSFDENEPEFQPKG